MIITKEKIRTLTPAEKYELLDMLWDSLEKGSYTDNAQEETDEELLLLHERLEKYKSTPSTGIKWENLKAELLKHGHE